MKYSLTMLLLAVIFNCNAQKKDSLALTFLNSDRVMFYLNSMSDYIEMNEADSIISIHGDTMKIIKYLLKLSTQKDSLNESLRETIAAGVQWMNCVPDYWMHDENNCFYSHYWKLLKKAGYYKTKLKEPRSLENCKVKTK